MKKIALIPARIGSTRFPSKLMADLGGKTVIRRTYESVVNMQLFDEVAVVCDSEILFNEIEKHGGKAIMSQKTHESGTDRIAEAAENMDADIIVNVQGDEPFVQKEPLEALLSVFENAADAASIQVASLMQVLENPVFIQDSNYVKVAIDLQSNALFFSRSPIPYPRNTEVQAVYYEHIGVYAFRKEALKRFTQLPMSPLEEIEKIECLRLLENGIKMKMVQTKYMGIEIDTAEDLERANALLKNKS